MSKFQIYFRSSSTGLLSTFLTKASGFVSVWILNQVLSKQGYGSYEFAYSLISVLLILGSAGLQHIVMYRLSRLDVPAETLAGRDLAGRLLRYSLLSSGIVCFLVILASSYITSDTNSFWIIGLSFLIPIRTSHGIYEAWFRSRQLIPEAIIYHQMLPSLAKVGFLLMIWLFMPNVYAVVCAILLSEVVPLVIRFIKTPLNILNRNTDSSLTRWDFKYAGQLALTTGVSQTVKYSDVLMMGILATSQATAEYVIASKLALLLIIAHQINNTIITPRIGRFLSKNDFTSIYQEYHESRILTLLFAFLGSLFFLLFGSHVLSIFGEYQSSYSVLLILSAAYVVHVSFGMSGGYLNIAGYSNLTLITTISVLFINVVVNYLLIPKFGSNGAAIAMLIGFTISNILTSLFVLIKDQLEVYTKAIAAFVSIFVFFLLLASFKIINILNASIILSLIITFYLYVERKFMKRFFYSLFKTITGR